MTMEKNATKSKSEEDLTYTKYRHADQFFFFFFFYNLTQSLDSFFDFFFFFNY